MMKTNVEKARELNILNDLLENNSEEDINKMTYDKVVSEWLEWEGIQGYSRKIITIVEEMRPKHIAEIIDELYAENHDEDGNWEIHLDDVDLGVEVEEWMYNYAMQLQCDYQLRKLLNESNNI